MGAWDEFIHGDLAGLDLKGKKVAIFGLGDQGGYGDNFCDAMDELMTCFKGSGADIVGSWSTDGYDHMESKSVDGAKFVGLACDEDNQPEMSEDRPDQGRGHAPVGSLCAWHASGSQMLHRCCRTGTDGLFLGDFRRNVSRLSFT